MCVLPASLDQLHFPHHVVRACLQLVEVDSTGHSLSNAVRTVPFHGMHSGAHVSSQKFSDESPPHIIDVHFCLLLLGQREPDLGCCIERIGIVLTAMGLD